MGVRGVSEFRTFPPSQQVLLDTNDTFKGLSLSLLVDNERDKVSEDACSDVLSRKCRVIRFERFEYFKMMKSPSYSMIEGAIGRSSLMEGWYSH